jgi:hypothetical protein
MEGKERKEMEWRKWNGKKESKIEGLDVMKLYLILASSNFISITYGVNFQLLSLSSRLHVMTDTRDSASVCIPILRYIIQILRFLH